MDIMQSVEKALQLVERWVIVREKRVQMLEEGFLKNTLIDAPAPYNVGDTYTASTSEVVKADALPQPVAPATLTVVAAPAPDAIDHMSIETLQAELDRLGVARKPGQKTATLQRLLREALQREAGGALKEHTQARLADLAEAAATPAPAPVSDLALGEDTPTLDITRAALERYAQKIVKDLQKAGTPAVEYGTVVAGRIGEILASAGGGAARVSEVDPTLRKAVINACA